MSLVAKKWLSDFETSLKSGNFNAVTALFADECYWRDLVSFTWNLKTLEGKDEILSMLNSCLKDVEIKHFTLQEVNENNGITEVFFFLKLPF